MCDDWPRPAGPDAWQQPVLQITPAGAVQRWVRPCPAVLGHTAPALPRTGAAALTPCPAPPRRSVSGPGPQFGPCHAGHCRAVCPLRHPRPPGPGQAGALLQAPQVAGRAHQAQGGQHLPWQLMAARPTCSAGTCWPAACRSPQCLQAPPLAGVSALRLYVNPCRSHPYEHALPSLTPPLPPVSCRCS